VESRIAVAGLFAVISLAAPVVLAQSDDVEEGRLIAKKFCGGCHAIGTSGLSNNPKAPPFRTLSAKYNVESLQESLGEGIVVGHPAMPQFQFKPGDVGAIIAYLKSLSGRG
jgi:mono/diheme cytochrome c family protein